MTEQEWLECRDPTPMLDFLRGKVGNRKLRLFACAWWRRQWQLLTEEEDRNAVVLAECFADGLTSARDLPEAFDENGRSVWPYVCFPAAVDAAYHADVAASTCAHAVAHSGAAYASERRNQTTLVRCIFGNPLRQVQANPARLHRGLRKQHRVIHRGRVRSGSAMPP